MGIINCACACNGDIDIVLNNNKMSTEDITLYVKIIQSNFRGYLARKEFKEFLQKKQKNIIHGVKFQKEWDITVSIINFKIPSGFEQTISNLLHTKKQILNFYKSEFFNHDIKNETKTCYTVKDSLYMTDNSVQFLTNFKILILNYLQETFDLGSKEKLMTNIVIEYEKDDELLSEKLMIEKEASSLNSTYLKNFTFNSNLDSSTREKQSKEKESPSNLSIKNKFIGSFDSKNKCIYQKYSDTEIKKISSEYNPGLKNNVQLIYLNKEDEQINRTGANLIKKRNANLPLRRNVLLQRSIDKNNEYIRAITNGSVESKKLYSLRINTDGGEGISNSKMNSNILFSPRYEVSNFTTLWGLNGRPTIENIIDEINQITEKNTKDILVNNDEGTFYEGQIIGKNSNKNGIGVQYLIDKSKGLRYKYLGYFKENKFHGYGIISREDGYHFKGEFRAGKKCGYGFEITDKWSYSGFFHNDKPHGYGEAIYLNKLTYYGCFNNGNKEHIGYIQYEDGSRYIGHFLLNKMFSIGMFFWPAGHFYFGEWKDDKMNGKGKYRWKNGDIYFGGYENDLRHGEGEYFFAESNSLLKGYWVNGQKNGKFKLIEGGECHIINYSKDKQVIPN